MSEVELRDARISYDIVGGGPATPMVWGHGLTSSRADENLMPLVDTAVIGRDRQVLRYDARGHGLSSDLLSSAEGDWAALALDQIALIDHLGWDEVILGGASMGTATALHATLALGDRVRALVLVIPPTAWETRATQVDLYAKMADAVERDGTEMLVAAARVTPPPDPFIDSDLYLERRIGMLESVDPARLAAGFRGAGTADLPPRTSLSAISVPTLVLAWSGDAGHPASTAEELGDILPNVQVVVSSSRDDLDTWTTRCRDFLTGR